MAAPIIVINIGFNSFKGFIICPLPFFLFFLGFLAFLVDVSVGVSVNISVTDSHNISNIG
jgi:hypothetical protein